MATEIIVKKNAIDPIQAKDQLDAVQALLKAFGPAHFAASMFWILQKKEKAARAGMDRTRLVPFLLNRAQAHLLPRMAQNNRILKGRQGGFTTFLLLMRLLLNIVTEPGKNGLLISQNSKYAALHFRIARRAYRYIGALDPLRGDLNTLSEDLHKHMLHTSYSSRRELVFDYLDSMLIVESAEVEEAGQGVTLHHVVSSETARWPGDPEATTSNVKGALVTDGTYDEESTANGMGGYFCEQYLASMNDEKMADARPHFYSWYWTDTDYVIPMTDTEKDEMELDLTADELRIIAQIHKEFKAAA